MRINDIIGEVKNYLYVRKTIRKNKDSVEWKKHNLSVGYFGVIYTVINLPPDVFEAEEQYYSVYVMEKMMPINNYLESLNLQEVVMPRVENLVNKETGVFAFGIKYIPLFRELTLWYVMTRLAAILGIVWTQVRFGLFTHGAVVAWDYIKQFFTWLF